MLPLNRSLALLMPDCCWPFLVRWGSTGSLVHVFKWLISNNLRTQCMLRNRATSEVMKRLKTYEMKTNIFISGFVIKEHFLNLFYKEKWSIKDLFPSTGVCHITDPSRTKSVKIIIWSYCSTGSIYGAAQQHHYFSCFWFWWKDKNLNNRNHTGFKLCRQSFSNWTTYVLKALSFS